MDPQISDSEPSTPDCAKAWPEAVSSIEIESPEAPPASDQADTAEMEPASEEPNAAVALEAPSPAADESVAALGTPLNAESADAAPEESELRGKTFAPVA